ncbi:uncharacterized protein PRCAT00003636001 [Priceomyces carsonii]|uniref:uncharacterized protein n=1 Tax=Priceomyces carsonii TaxID=28549 RepID=UPI002ED877F6|nr:unnamed protein product [Priceomyces carsonii]
MSDLISYRMKVTTKDNRNFVGSLLAFDKHYNLVLSDTEELRITKKTYQELKRNVGETSKLILEEKRSLGLIILRGDQIVTLNIESPPPLDATKRIKLEKGKGVSKPMRTPVSVKARTNQLQGPAKGNLGFRRQ